MFTQTTVSTSYLSDYFKSAFATKMAIILCLLLLSTGCGPSDILRIGFGASEIKYRTKGASDAILASYGLRRKREHNYERQGRKEWANVVPYKASTREVNAKEYDRIIATARKGRGEGKINYDREKQATYKIVEVQVEDLRVFAEEINKSIVTDESFAKFLKIGSSVRFITAVLLVFDHETSQNFKVGVEIEAKLLTGPSGGLEILRGSQEQIKVADGNVIGFRMSRLCWDNDETVGLLLVDEKGSDRKECEDFGYSERHPAQQ